MKDSSATKVLIIGTFDMPHLGHFKLFERARQSLPHSHLVVAVNTDEFVKRFKREPIMSLEERMKTLRHIKWVDEVVINEGNEDCKPVIKAVKPDVIAHGSDWMGESLMKQMGISEEFLSKHGISMVYLPYSTELSTSELIKRCNEKNRSNNSRP